MFELMVFLDEPFFSGIYLLFFEGLGLDLVPFIMAPICFRTLTWPLFDDLGDLGFIHLLSSGVNLMMDFRNSRFRLNVKF